MIFRALFWIFALSFGRDSIQPSDEILKKHVKTFEKEFGVTVDYPVSFYTEDSRTLGYCKYFKILNIQFPMFIRINVQQWVRITKSQQKLVMMHELAHCSLDLHHIDTRLADGCPKYLMHPFLMRNSCIKKYGEKYYIDSLRKQMEEK